MAMSSGEALAVETLARAAAGIGDLVERDELHAAITVLFASGAKRPNFGFGPSDVDHVTDAIWKRDTTTLPDPEWTEDDLDDDGGTDEGEAELPAPRVRLPEFEGIIPVGIVTNMTGVSQRISRAIHIDELGVAVVEWELDSVNHKRTKDGVKRHQALKVLELFELEGSTGRRLLNHLKERYRAADDVDPLPFKHSGDEALVDAVIAGRTDGSGVAFTPSEAAELGIGSADPVTVIFDDGKRAVWPDDFPTGMARPVTLGARIRVPGRTSGDLGEVVQLLDFLTNLPLEGAGWADDEDAVGAPVDAGDEEG